jgi:hypothetical protein
MIKRLRIAIGLLLASVLGLIVWQASDPPEPIFEGRRLMIWLDHHVASSGARPPYNSPGWKKADEALRTIGTNAIPTLLKMIRAKDPPPLVLKLLETARRLVPALMSALKDPNVNVRWNALVGLSIFGGRARPAVPEILKMINDPGMVGGSSITQQVETALWRIAPEKVGKPLLVEDTTPMIVNGVTAEALKVTFHGERKTLIPAGRPVPAVAQYWNSDPRPKLTLYRGASASADSDHFHGHFEVLGLPASDNPNVSTLCVVANGQITLCARDNHRDMFLEIRRVETESAK